MKHRERYSGTPRLFVTRFAASLWKTNGLALAAKQRRKYDIWVNSAESEHHHSNETKRYSIHPKGAQTGYKEFDR
jgi:hypothetical protein